MNARTTCVRNVFFASRREVAGLNFTSTASTDNRTQHGTFSIRTRLLLYNSRVSAAVV